MKSPEKQTYLFAVIIVVLGTLVITIGFTVGLLFLTGPDNRVLTEEKVPFEIKKTESSDLIHIIQIESGWIESRDVILSGDITDEDIISDKTDLKEYLISLSIDKFMQVLPDIKKLNIWGSASYRTGNSRWILIDKSNFSLTLYNRDKVLHVWRIAVGIDSGDKQRKGDNKTPNGIFKIRQIQNSSEWEHDFGDGKGMIKGAYGPWFIRLHTPPWAGIGIHGTHDPDSIGSRASEGCIRMSNEDVSELKKLVKVGMPVVIVE